jgi:hypothetical protein
MEPSEEVQLLCAHHNGLLPERSFKIAPVRAPPFAIELVRHDLKHDNVVPLGPAALLRSREGWAAVTTVAEALQVQDELSDVEVAAVCRAAYGGREARHGTRHQHWPPTLEMLRSGFLPK